MEKCDLCPRHCFADRNSEKALGFCGESNKVYISRASLHKWEEPCISGKNGSGAVFFCSCNLRCVFCQNKIISTGGGARFPVSKEQLKSVFFRLEEMGAENINLVTPTHFLSTVIPALEESKSKLNIPVVYNTSGYENLNVLKRLDGLIDIYLPDFKYASSDLAAKYSKAADYPSVALSAIKEMYRQVGSVRFLENGAMTKGLIIRHLVLPACRHDSMDVLKIIASSLPVKDIRLSLMSQYTPEFAMDCEFKNLHRRLTSFEYKSVLDLAVSLGFEGYFQQSSSASDIFTPDFSGECGEGCINLKEFLSAESL